MLSHKLVVRYASRQAVCRACPLRTQCLAANGKLREIERWVHEDVIEGTGRACASRVKT